MHGRATPFEQTSRAAKQGAGADGKATVGTRSCLLIHASTSSSSIKAS